MARYYKVQLAKRCGGRMPSSARGWRLLAESYNIHVGPLARTHRGFTARLFYDENAAHWFIAHAKKPRPDQLRRWIAHELFEYLAAADFPQHFACDFEAGSAPILRASDSAVFAYDGLGDGRDLRHLIACYGEKLCFRR